MTERIEQITGLRELADWLEAHPEAPLQYGQEFQVFILGDDREAAVADLSDVGATLGIAPTRQHKTSPHLRVAVQFSGDISYAVIACDVPRELYEDRADQDITQGEGEVGASSAVEAPTAPGDGHVYECCGKVGRISRHNAWCETGQALGGAA